ncbi:MAG: hypothetical protein M3044_07820, partial [Thermoproteota archaeon]|nr:hypothetical protein [Thermoproteota archaeon]
MSKTISMYDVMESEGAKRFLDSIARNSKSSKDTYAAGLTHFQRFLDDKRENHTLQSIIAALKMGEINVYELLDEFVSYLIGLKNGNDRRLSISSRSITIYLAAVRSYLDFNDVEIVIRKFKRMVKVPKLYREDEQAIDAQDIREILLSCNNRRLKPYLL